ncbi:MAG TPA: TldD/PmbA family protein [Ktedonobacterales bacterium]|nr:TldD/PmbA family protein [Ktedonobacterales bacterium]
MAMKGLAMVATDERRDAVVQELVGELEARFPYAAALLSGASGVQISDSGQEQQASETSPAQGAVFTVYDGATFNEYATSELAPDALASAVRQWANGLRRRDGPPISFGGHATLAGQDVREFATPMQIDPASVPLKRKLALVRDIQRRAQTMDARIVQAQVRYADSATASEYIGRGRWLRQRVHRLSLSLFVVMSDGGETRYNFLPISGAGGFELAQVTDEQLRETVETAARLLDAGRIEPGIYDTITDPSLSGVIAHECFGHGVEMDLFPKGRSRAAQFVGRQVAAPDVAMYDDPSLPGAFGSYFFDDEGELARPTQILRDGVLLHPISDFAAATYAGHEAGAHTANGRRQDYTRKAYARMSNTFFGSGSIAPAAMIAGVERGVYLRRAMSGMEDPMGWGIQVSALYGEEIVNGALTGRLFSPVGVSGYVPDLLAGISAIGNDMRLEAGQCGKGHKEYVDVTVGGPHLRMKARLG